MSSERPNIVVIGGGIGGLSTAAHLAEDQEIRSIYDIYVVEMLGGCGRGTTSRAYGIASGTLGGSESVIRLNVESRRVYQQEFENRFGTKLDLNRVGEITLSLDAPTASRHERQTELQNTCGLETRMLTRAEVGNLMSDLNTQRVVAGMYSPTDFRFNPADIIETYKRFAESKGVNIVLNTEATGIVKENDRIMAVETTGGRIESALVINAAGIKAGIVGQWADQELPVLNRTRSLLTVQLEDPVGQIPLVAIEGDKTGLDHCYLGPDAPRIVKVGIGITEIYNGDLANPGLAIRANENQIKTAQRFLAEFFPSYVVSGEISGYLGIRSETENHEPVLGPAKGVVNLFHCAGLGGQGIELAPSVARIITESVREGRISKEMERFSPEREARGIFGEREN